MINFWNALSRAAKIGFVSGLILILAVTSLVGYWLLRVDYQVLFADLKPQDSAVMVGELDRLKIPYKIGDSGNTILVEKDIVHSTRLKLLGKDLPLHGVVGLELFNSSDFGMTEFAQKINYQRALQGEITRTISSLDEIQDVRVHLALPEEGLFKRATSKPKAAITIALKAGHVLRSEQTLGIQRLVAAAVPGILAQDVTIVDKRGVALTRPVNQTEQDFIATSLELKKETEAVLSKKVNEVLVKTFGEDKASASVDVILNMDQVKVTTEDVLSAPNVNGQATGVIVKDKESLRDLAAPLDTINGMQTTKSGTSQREVEYQVGRRIEQIVSQPGAIKRLSAVAVIHKELNAVQQEQVKAMVAAAVGASIARGDNVVVQSMGGFESKELALGSEGNQVQEVKVSERSELMGNHEANNRGDMFSLNTTRVMIVLLVIILVILAVILISILGKKPVQKNMSDQERAQALKSIQGWMSNNSSGSVEVPDSKLTKQERSL